MNITILDINGTEIELGDTLLAYDRSFETEEVIDEGDHLVIVLDTTKPKPLADVPVYKGRIEWSNEHMSFILMIDEVLVAMDNPPSSISMGWGDYAYEVIGRRGDE